ncbi:hypothetical protein PoB_003936000 [Plakobranchus ocellatus]|uniref:Uncharacterized protein n=1 Tax=Plakobranchus ocellatus TaxID=259542 RepID=A0AAV4B197_9GAST|nr:hypothetical protein PoB_003936000 [Plakobranchus ocellatus]
MKRLRRRKFSMSQEQSRRAVSPQIQLQIRLTLIWKTTKRAEQRILNQLVKVRCKKQISIFHLVQPPNGPGYDIVTIIRKVCQLFQAENPEEMFT